MKRLLAPAVAALLMAAALPAQAHPVNHFLGNCGYDTISDTTPTQTLGGPERFTGVIWVYVVPTTSDYVPLPSAHVEVDCEIYVDGVLTDVALSASGTGVAAAAGTFSFDLRDDQWVEACTRVTIDGVEHPGCGEDIPLPPEEPLPLDPIFDLLDGVTCTTFRSLAPGIPGVVDIDAGGDISIVGLGLFWDCPPFAEEVA